MNLQTVLTALSFMTATMILLIGIVLLTGFFLPEGIPVNYRYTLGALMTLYAAYRIGLLWYKTRSASREAEAGGIAGRTSAGGIGDDASAGPPDESTDRRGER